MKPLTAFVLTMFTSIHMSSAEWLPLWPGEAPGGAKPVVVKESEGEGGRLTDIAVPQYEVYLPDASRRTGAAVVILPGGGYTIVSANNEGRDYARWLNERGIVAILTKYRVSGNDAAGYQFPVPLLDARRAIRVARSMAKEWGVDPAKVGVMGSSAGGHLASMCATLWDEKFSEEGTDEIDRLGCRPDFTILVYPVIAMGEIWCHAGSQRRLLGAAPEPALVARVSTAKRVTHQTPPCFLIHAADDGGVPVRNSLEFAARCAENRVPVVCHVFAEGGHGFGMKGKGDSANWPDLLEKWLARRKLATATRGGDADE
jgi:acetyl esterase/lipase